MNIEYSKIGDSVFITDQDGNVSKRENVDNIERILVLENVKEKMDEKIKRQRKEQKKYRRQRNVFLAISAVPLINNVTLMATGHGDGVSPYLTGALVLTSGFTSLVMTGLAHTFDDNIKRINICKKALDTEIKFELSRSNKVNSTENVEGNLDIKTTYDLIYDTYDMLHDTIIEDYKQNGKVTCPVFDEVERRVFSTMAKEEILKDTNIKGKKVKVKEI